MGKPEISDAISSVLGSTENSPGIEPTQIKLRLCKLPSEIQHEVEFYLNRMMQFPLPTNSDDLAKLGAAAEEWASIEMPELKTNARKSLSDYYTFHWR